MTKFRVSLFWFKDTLPVRFISVTFSLIVSTELHSSTLEIKKMEQNLDKLLDDTLESPGVMGVLCADKQGLCYSAKGTVSVGSAGIIASLSHQASLLVPESSNAPVICLESDKGNVLIKSHQDVTIAIHKMPTSF